MMDADTCVTFVANRPVAARQQQRRTLYGDGLDIIDGFSFARKMRQASITA